MSRDQLHHVPVIGTPPEEVEHRVTVIFDAKTGKMIGRSPHVDIRQVMHKTRADGAITTTLKITPVKGE